MVCECTAPRSRFGAGTVSENNRHGVSVGGRVAGDGQVTVANAEEDKPQTVCKDNGKGDADLGGEEGRDWNMQTTGEIIGIPQEKIQVTA